MATIKATHTVQPAEPTPEEVMYLNAGDQIKDISHTPTLYFYKHSAALDSMDAVSRLKDSLGKALVPFYPLAGRLSRIVEGGGGLSYIATAEGSRFSKQSRRPRWMISGTFVPLRRWRLSFLRWITPLRSTKIPMVIVQLTKFRCGGVAIGLGVSHVMADGPSALHFVNEWAKISRGATDPVAAPFLDRRVLEIERPLNSDFDAAALRPPPTLIDEEDTLEQRKRPITVAFLNLTKPQIETLRSRANLDAASGGRGYSRFEAIAAHIWRCTSKARGHAAEQQTSLHFVADFRNKLNPPLPPNYFGNALIRVEATDKSGSLLSNTIGAAAGKIREAVEKVSDESVRGYLDYLKNLSNVGCFRTLDNNGRPKGNLYGNPNLAIISWTALPLYGADFGWGKEVSMGPGSMGFDGKTFILPSHGGGASLNIAIWLQEQHMGGFKECFYHDI